MLGRIFYYLGCIAFVLIPVCSVGFFVASLVRYISAIRANKKNKGTYTAEEIRDRRLLLIVSSVILGILVAVVVGFTALLFFAVAYM
ncbi:MAG: hypothetical protein IJN63_07720 [Clostridia bacterium]|nr:hypothetical protein [Clostridia bacterium]